MTIKLKQLEIWFITGSQHLYGPETLKQVAKHSQEIARALNDCAAIPTKVIFKPVMTTPDDITALCEEANHAKNCIGLITWCHTFSPSKMWINGLKQLRKPICHLHTQYNRDIPWSTIDMDFMNMNQAAHGDREHGFIMSRLRLNRKVVVGFWQEEATQEKIGDQFRVLLDRKRLLAEEPLIHDCHVGVDEHRRDALRVDLAEDALADEIGRAHV